MSEDNADALEAEDGIVEEVLDDRPMMVRSGLFIGSALAGRNKQRLKQCNITHVLQVAEGLYPFYPMEFSYMIIQVQDVPGEDLVVHFTKAFEFMDRAIERGGCVLVHCLAGISRSATMVLGYMMSRDGMPLDAALAHLKEVRPWVCPNVGFLQQLQEYERLEKDLSRWRAWRHVWQGTLPCAAEVDGRAIIAPPPHDLPQPQSQQRLNKHSTNEGERRPAA